jgi:hypothetical protein
VNDYINNFTAYMLHVGITSELQQVNLFVTLLQKNILHDLSKIALEAGSFLNRLG